MNAVSEGRRVDRECPPAGALREGGSVEIRHDIEVARPPSAVLDFLVATASSPVVDQALSPWSPEV